MRRRTVRTAMALCGAVVLALGAVACEEDLPGADGGTGAGTPTGSPAGDEPAGDEATGDEPTGDEATGDGSTGGDAEAVRPYVVNFFGEANADGAPDQEPGTLVLTEFTTVTDVTWEEWNGTAAIGTGSLSGTWCLPECLENPYPTSVVLSDTGDFGGDPYYTTFLLEPDVAISASPEDLDGVRPLATP